METPAQPTNSTNSANSSSFALHPGPAYKLQIPKMDTLAPIKCAFARITHGIALEVFEANRTSQLLYAV